MAPTALRINTVHFGCVDVPEREVLRFPLGLFGLKSCCRWVLLTPPESTTVRWLQCVDRPEVALAVVDPRRFVPDYQIRAYRRELSRIELRSSNEADLLVTVSRTRYGLTLDLKAPLVINRRRRLGRQVIANDELNVQYLVEPSTPRILKKIA